MNHSNEQSLGEVIKAFLKKCHLEEKIKETRILSSWERVMGKNIARYTSRVELRKTTLIIHMSSSVLRNELSMAKSKIIDMINEEAGEKVIDKIIFR